MLKKMRWRFVWLAMAAFSAVILILLLSINLWNYHATISQLDNTVSVLETISAEGDTPPANTPGFAFPGFSPEFQYMIRFFTVAYDSDGVLTEVNQDYIASVTKEDAAQYAAAVTSGRSSSGFYQGYRYRSTVSGSGTLVIFLNAEREISYMHSLLTITAVIAFCSLLMVFLLVFAFSKRAIAPFVNNINAQKSFITNASHELKTPLTAISTSADLLSMEQPENEWVQNIQNQTAQLSALIYNMVTLTRLDEERPASLITEFSLSDTVWEVSEPFSSRAHAAGKQFICDIEDGISISGDQTAAQQLLSVLLDNALKYSDAGGSIRLGLHRSGKRIDLQVTNTCTGAAQLDTSKLFERFYRGDTSHNSSIPGSGIGLSIAKAAAEANKGSISVRTTEDTITFQILL